MQEKFNADFENMKKLICIIADADKVKLKELYESDDLNIALEKQKEKLFSDLVKQNSIMEDYKEYLFENKPITKEVVDAVNKKKSNFFAKFFC